MYLILLLIGKLFVDATVLKFDKVGTYAIGPNDYGLNKFVKINVDYVNVNRTNSSYSLFG